MINLKKIGSFALAMLLTVAVSSSAMASEIDLKVPSLDVAYNIFGWSVTGAQLLLYGMGICVLGMIFGLAEFLMIKKLPAHQLMLNVSNTIYETCKTYMK